MEAKAAPTPAAKARRQRGGTPAPRQAHALERGRPDDDRQRHVARQRVGVARGRSRAGAPRPASSPLRETPGIERAGLREPERERVDEPASSRRRPVGADRSASAIAADAEQQADGDGRRRAQALARSGARACSRRSPAARTSPGTSTARRRSRPRAAAATSSRSPTSSAAAVPACSATSKALRSSGSSVGVGPAEQPRDERRVRRGGDRAAARRARGAPRAPARGASGERGVRPGHPRRPRCGCAASGTTRYTTPTTISAATA